MTGTQEMAQRCRDCVNRFICRLWPTKDGRTLCVEGSCYEKDEKTPEDAFSEMA